MKNRIEIIIREIKSDEVSILEDMLYESIYQPDETNPISREVINVPKIRVYIDNFAQKKDDYCLVAKDYKQTSLSVQKENYVVRMYQKLGFEIIGENNEDYLMLLKL